MSTRALNVHILPGQAAGATHLLTLAELVKTSVEKYFLCWEVDKRLGRTVPDSLVPGDCRRCIAEGLAEKFLAQGAVSGAGWLITSDEEELRTLSQWQAWGYVSAMSESTRDEHLRVAWQCSPSFLQHISLSAGHSKKSSFNVFWTA